MFKECIFVGRKLDLYFSRCMSNTKTVCY